MTGNEGALGSMSKAMLQTTYDPEADLLRLRFGPEDAAYDGATEVAPGVFVEFDTDGNAIGIEILSVKLRASGAYGQPAKAAAE
jgi:uncharacterized protein YuzE